MSENVNVALRIRPLVASESARGCLSCVQCVQNAPQVTVTGGLSFSYNFVFDSDTTQQDVYEGAVQPLVFKLFKGYNVTILAYGQTGSGKTHTMGSNYQASGDNGIIPRAVQEIFVYIQDHSDWEYKITVSFMELYKEQLFDLLAPKRTVVKIREDTKGIYIPGLTEVTVTSAESSLKCLQDGSLGRVTGATAMNQQSSRSHAIFTLTIHQQKVGDPHSATSAKFHMVDLAGSERSKKTQAEGDRFKEGVTINAGLLALGNVIAALGEGSKHVPSYRNSKLTRLLQDSLGGNSLTLMIACISPADYNLEETLSTLRYADRARKIKNNPIVNQDPKNAEIASLKQKVHELQLLLLGQGGCHLVESVESKSNSSEYEQRIKELEGKLREMRQGYDELLTDAATMREKLLLAESSGDRLKEHFNELNTEIHARLDSFSTLNLNSNQLLCLEDLQNSFKQRLGALLDEHNRFSAEQREQESAPDNNVNVIMEVEKSEDELRVIDEEQEVHASKQKMLHQELKQLSKDLAQKEEYWEKYMRNKIFIEESLKESNQLVVRYEREIADLVKARDELSRQLQAADEASGDSGKQAELLKKNMEIELLQKKINEQTKLIRKKEMAEKRVDDLNNEIRQMKQMKVKLIKQMKQENDRWRIWRIERERETAKLRDQDRKRQNEIKRLQILHSKQQIVSKRKLEEALSANKRLKEALSRRKTVRGQRELKNAKDQVQEFVREEVEIALTTEAAKRTLQQLMEERSEVTCRIAEMRRLTFDSSMQKRIASSEQQLELYNIQIQELQQKLVDPDLENRSKTGWEKMNSMADMKVAVRCAISLAAENCKESYNDDVKHLKVEAVRNEFEKEMTRLKQSHHQDLINIEEQYNLLLEESKQRENDTNTRTLMELQLKNEECLALRDKLEKILSVTNTPRIKARKNRTKVKDINIISEETCEAKGVGDYVCSYTPIRQTAETPCLKPNVPCDENCACTSNKISSPFNTNLDEAFVNDDVHLAKRQKISE